MNTKIYADFHNLDDENRLKLTSVGTKEDLERLGVTLREGLELTFYTDDANDQGEADDLLVDGVVEYDRANQCWVAKVDWSAVKHSSDLTPGNGAADRRPATRP